MDFAVESWCAIKGVKRMAVVRFWWNQKKYEMSEDEANEAYRLNRILLPDYTLLAIQDWLRSIPPIPDEFNSINHTQTHLELQQTAKILNAVLVREV